LNVHQIRRIDHHPAENVEDGTPQSISDTEYSLDWNGDLDDPNEGEDDCEADYQCYEELGNAIKVSECPEHWVVSAAPNVPRLIPPTWRSIKHAEHGLMTVDAMETRQYKGNKKK